MDNKEVIEASAQVIEAPATLGEADRWLAAASGKVEAARAEWTPFVVETAEQYRDSKRCRAALRQEIAAIDSERKGMTRDVERAVKAFKDRAAGILAPLKEADEAFKANQSAYEERVVGDRLADMRAGYEAEWPDLAAVLGFDSLEARYGDEGKWRAMSTSRKAAAESLAKACEDVARNLGTIANTGDPADAERRQADYLRDLDFARHLRDMAERQRREEALRRQREERERWEAERAAAGERAEAERAERERAEREQAERMAEDARIAAQDRACDAQAAAPAPIPAQPVSGPENAPQAVTHETEEVLLFEVRVPRSKFRQFRDAMVAMGVHGSLVKDKE